MKHLTILTLAICAFILQSCTNRNTISIKYNPGIAQVAFAVSDLKQALENSSYQVDSNGSFRVIIELDKESGIKAEGFRIQKTNKDEITIFASDANGLMYGVLELAELINIKKKLNQIDNITDQPYIPKRGIKFNIPLDVRTSSFDDSGDAAQENIAEMWNIEFWVQFFDNMARYRYNAISFWNAHPFSSMVKLEDYPDVALQNVCGTTIKPQENPHYWNVPELASSKIVENLKVVKEMTIEDKILFWRKVMKHAKNRGIDVYFITWNICLNGAAVPGPNKEVGNKKGKYGISNDYKNKTSIDYLRKSVKQFILNYPDLTGLGVTAGENMRAPMNDDDKEKWLWDTYGMGIMDAKELQPEREIKFIHRFWWTDAEKVSKYWGEYPDQFDMSFKYAKARLYSSVNPPFSQPLISWMEPLQLKSWWNLRNDDIFIHRWGDPEYVSSFIKHMPYEQTAGFRMGSDGYVWGREFISMNPETPRQLEINKHWYRFMLWGRLGYNPDIEQERFESLIAHKFSNTNAQQLYSIWKTASKIIPQVNRFHWRDWDYMWAVEACTDTWNMLRTVDDFRITKTMEGENIINPVDYVKAKIINEAITSVTPIMVADSLTVFAQEAIDGAEKLINESNSRDLKHTLLDIQSMGHLGNYYADKIRAAVELEFYKSTGKQENKEASVKYLQNAVKNWELYRDINIDRYKRQNLARVRTVDFSDQLVHVKKDVVLALNALTYEEEKIKDKSTAAK